MVVSSGSSFVVWFISPFLPLVIPCILLLLIKKLWYEYNVSTRDPSCPLPLPGGTMGWPLIGETPLLAIKGSKFFEARFEQYGRLFKTHIFGKPTVRIWGAENIRKVLMGEREIVESSWPTSTNILMGSQSFTQSRGHYHTNMRRHIMAAFSNEALAEYMPLIQDPIQEAISDWCKEESVLVYPECRSLAFRVASKVLCGFEYNKEEMSIITSTFKEITDGLLTLPYDIPGSGLHKALKAREAIFDKIAESVGQIENDMDDGRQKPSALRILMDEIEKENGTKPSLQQMQEAIVDLLVAGFESLGSASTNVILELFKNPQVLQKLRDELEEHGLDTPGSPISYDHIKGLNYVNCVVKESLRMSPPIGGGFRKALKTFEIEGKQIPKGWTVLLSYRDTIKYSDLYCEKERFDPDRFSKERAEDKHGDRFNYCVFGGGKRSCVGKEFALLLLKVLLIELVRNVKWELQHPDDLRFSMMPVPHPVDGMPVQFSHLQDCNSNSVKTVPDAAINKCDLTDSLQTLIAA